jgi:hypothetical protein
MVKVNDQRLIDIINDRKNIYIFKLEMILKIVWPAIFLALI